MPLIKIGIIGQESFHMHIIMLRETYLCVPPCLFPFLDCCPN